MKDKPWDVKDKVTQKSFMKSKKKKNPKSKTKQTSTTTTKPPAGHLPDMEQATGNKKQM